MAPFRFWTNQLELDYRTNSSSPSITTWSFFLCFSGRPMSLCRNIQTHPVWRLEQPVNGGKLVDERQVHTERVQGRPRGIREIRAVRERIHVVQVLDPARQGHFAQILFPFPTRALIVTLYSRSQPIASLSAKSVQCLQDERNHLRCCYIHLISRKFNSLIF